MDSTALLRAPQRPSTPATGAGWRTTASHRKSSLTCFYGYQLNLHMASVSPHSQDMRNSRSPLRAMLPLQKIAPSPCWLGIRFPHLALDLHTRGQARNGLPVAVGESVKRRELIIDCNPAALAAGVKPGMPATAALGILAGLHVVERDTGAEQRALQRLAAWCYQYSNQVNIPGDRAGLFLEAGASERLFGRPQGLGSRLERELGQLGYHVMAGLITWSACWATGPTPVLCISHRKALLHGWNCRRRSILARPCCFR